MIIVDTLVTTVALIKSGKLKEESENAALNPLLLSLEPTTVKHTVTTSFVGKVWVGGTMPPQNLELPLIEGLMVTQLA